ncbi:MAG: chitobiase/beta-hexosaminidase C-terminal domain-containing protein, partial [Treponema sp.]|nr:chitobiase/beta-hexosaminidase C-terminal domain-containing protein [Treponema sp.]
MKKLASVFFSLIFLFSSIELTAQINVLSPVEGTWANKQMLVIDDSDNNEYLYSINGSDPELFGFAYDGPVLIDMTGEVELQIKKLGSRDSKVIHFNV